MNETIQPPDATTPDSAETPQAPSKRFRWQTVVVWLGVIGLLVVTGWGLQRTTATRPEAGQPAPDFDIEFFNGYGWQGEDSAELGDFKGQVVVINFWASWCVECYLEAELLEDTWRQYADEDVVFLGVAYADVEPKAMEYLAEFDITYPNGPDLGTDISDTYEITGVPETFFIDKQGVIRHVQIGPVDAATMDGVIRQMLSEEG